MNLIANSRVAWLFKFNEPSITDTLRMLPSEEQRVPAARGTAGSSDRERRSLLI